jgi:peptide deformylase
MIYPITVYGDPILRKKTEDIPQTYEGLKKLAEDMFETMHNADGVGIAAPQIGLSLRIFVVDLSAMEEEYPELKDFRKAFVNPHIVLREGEEELMNEGCLSIPGIREDVPREEHIRIRYFDLDWNEHDETYTGWPARVLQHEYDHLDGILFIDHCSPFKRRLLKSKLTDITKGKVSTSYKIKLPKTAKV